MRGVNQRDRFSWMLSTFFLWLLILGTFPSTVRGNEVATIPIPDTGNASLTHYDLPLDHIAACGCSTTTSLFPTAALSSAAYGSATSSGPACGMCFNLTLKAAYEATPPFNLTEGDRPWIVVKINDKCPTVNGERPGGGWCGGTADRMNKGVNIHFDLSSPSPAIPLSWFPVPNSTTYGYSNFGAWLVEFSKVSCELWSGYNTTNSSIVDTSLGGDSGCCPLNPLVNNDTCTATSLIAGASRLARPVLSVLGAVAVIFTLLF